MKIPNSNDSAMDIIAQVLEEMKASQGNDFSYANINLAELERLTGLSRQRLRTLKKKYLCICTMNFVQGLLQC